MADSFKVAVFADIHSNKRALEACIRDSKMFGVSEYIVAGDIICDWHEPNETIDIVRSLTPLVIKGNWEQAISEYKAVFDIWEIYEEYASILWTYNTLTQENRDYIKNLPKVLTAMHDDLSIRIVHGSPFNVNEGLYLKKGIERIHNALKQISENVLIFAHTHEQSCTHFGEKVAINPGSVGEHYNEECAAEYCILEIVDGKLSDVIFRKVKYDFDASFMELLQSPLYKNAFVRILIVYLGMCEGKNVLIDFQADIDEERSKDEFAGSGPIPNDIYNMVFDDKYQQRVAGKLFLGR